MLPPNRQLKKLWEICKFQNGFAFQSNSFKDKWEPILRISNIQNNWFSNERLVFFNPSNYGKNLDDFIVYPWDLVIAMSWATTWKLAINNTNIQYYLNQRVWKFIFDDEITKEYCHLFLSTKIAENLQQSAWSAIPNLSTEQIKNILIPLPPLATQHKIVAKLDEISANIQDSKSKITDEINKLDKLWASSLGKVFEKWWWKLQTINSISHKIQYWYTWKTTEKGQFRYLRITDIQNDNVEWEKVPFVEISPEEAKKYELNTGDVVFARTGATVGKSFLIDKIGEDKIFASYLIRVVPNYEYIKPEFLKYFFQSEIYWSQILADVVWAAQPNFNGKKLGEIIIPLPDLETQKSIVSHLDQLSQTISHIKAEYQWQLAYHDDLWASVLDQAFKGELVKE